MKLTKRILALALIAVTLLTLMAVTASAASTTAFNMLSGNNYAKTYMLSSNGRTIPYTSKSLTTRGTTTYGASSTSYIDNATDEIYVMDVGCTNGKYWAYVSYPTASRRVNAYIYLSTISDNNGSHEARVSTGKFYCSTRYNTALSTSYYVAKGDTVYLISTSGPKYQIMYPTSNGKFRIAWCNASDYEKYCGCADRIVSDSAISAAASKYGISPDSSAYAALQSINTKYGDSFTSAQKAGALVFMFEGVGTNSSASARMNAMCVVVKNGQIVYLNRSCSTIPDRPFTPWLNDGTPMPTLKSGIYDFTTCNHRGSYAALNVSNATVVRFRSQSSWYDSTACGINVHRRSTNYIPSASAGWVNSAGCLLVGRTGTSAASEYARFIQALGIVSGSASGSSKYTTYVTGKIIVDRTYAYDYLRSVGYSTSAIESIG